MLPRRASGIGCILAQELPILPFLAPRVFTPWPNGFPKRRAHASAQALERKPNNATFNTITPYIADGGASVISTTREQRKKVGIESTGKLTNNLNGESSVDTPQKVSFRQAQVPEEPCDERAHPTSPSRDAEKGTAIAVGSTGRSIQRQDKARHRRLAYRKTRSVTSRITSPVRTKFVRLALREGSQLDAFSSLWSVNFTRLSRKYDSQLDDHRAPQNLDSRIGKNVRIGRYSIESIANISCRALTEEWNTLSATERGKLWPQIMLQALQRSPPSALKFLVASLFKPYPPSYAISDSMEYILCYYLYRVENPHPEDVEVLFNTTIRLLDHVNAGYVHMSQKTIFWLLSNLEIDDASKLYTTLVLHGHPLHENTLLHFVDLFSRAGKIKLAVDALRRLQEGGADFTKPHIESVCATLLQRRYRSRSEVVLSDSDLFALMLDLGLRPNIIFYNILLQNATDAGDSETAWQIHDMMLENSVKADANTYSILLNDAKLRMDQPSIERILGLVRSEDIRNEYIVTDLLHAIFLLSEQERKDSPTGCISSSPFKKMLSLYGEYFDTHPMKGLLTPTYEDFLAGPVRGKMRPPKQTLVVMFIALLRGFTNKQATPEWYDRFRELVLKGDPDITPLAESTRIYDAVIMSLGRWHGTLHLCTNVIRDMFDSYAQAQNAGALSRGGLKISGRFGNDELEVSNSDDGSGYVSNHCQPSVRTWSVLLKAFMDHNQPRAAEKVLAMMQSQGITPNQITWNSLAVGYARMQDIANAVGVIERFENEGWGVDDCTMAGLQWIRNRETLIQALQQKDQRQEEKQRVYEMRDTVPASILNGGLGEVINKAEDLYTAEQKHSRHRKDTISHPGSEVTPVRSADRSRLLKFDASEIVFPEDTDRIKVDFRT